MTVEPATAQELVHAPQSRIHERLQRQEELERECCAEGVRKFREALVTAQQQGRQTEVGAARKLLQEGIDPLARAFSALVEQARPGRKHPALKWITMVGPEPLAYLTIRTVVGMATPRVLLHSAAKYLTSVMEDEMRFRRFREKAPGLFKYKIERFTTSHYGYRAQFLDTAIKNSEVDTSDLELKNQDAYLIGVKLIDVLMEVTSLVSLNKQKVGHGRRGVTTETWVELTPETVEWLCKANNNLETFWPVYWPMVVPPMQWAPDRRGGYRFALKARHRLVRGISKPRARTLMQADMPLVYQALNAIQETPWAINHDVLALVEQITERGEALAGVPAYQDEALPLRPQDIATNEEARKGWRKRAHAVKERNHIRKLKAATFSRTVGVARKMKDEGAIYFPATLDFRGRVYPVCHYLNPQGDDVSKALLTFHEGKAVGSKGAVWLALHGANCLGETNAGLKLSKCTQQERVDWIVEHTNDIAGVVADPFGTVDFWAHADVDDPLQFYAFCCEWTRYAEAHRAGKGTEYVSHLPCAMDGTCNGLQHFSALLRDPVGAEAVNVSPSDRPQDIYQRVADAVLRMLEDDATDNELARLWLSSGLVKRKLAKRPTMTFGYGSKKYGFKQQTVEYLRKLFEERPEVRPLFADGDKKDRLIAPASEYMAGLIWDALQETVIAAGQAMAWMQLSARLVAKEKKCLSWTVPVTGFPVKQEYMSMKSRRIETILSGKVFKPVLQEATDDPDVLRQANGIAPNFVHSLDAAALQLTVVACVAAGVSSFAMVHDSYGTHAADCETLATKTREQFVRLYSEVDVIGSLDADLRVQFEGAPDEFPPVPRKGDLDLNIVHQSRYFFS